MASWYGDDGRRIQRRIGPARTPGERDGLTKTEAEREFRRIREPTAAGRCGAGHGGRGRRRTLTPTRAPRPQEVPSADGRIGSPQPPRALLREQAAQQNHAGRRRAVHRRQTGNACGQDDPQPPRDAALPSSNSAERRGWCRENPVKLADRPVVRKTETRLQFLEPAELEAPPRHRLRRRRVRSRRASALPHGGDDRAATGRAARPALAGRRLQRAPGPSRVHLRSRGVRRSRSPRALAGRCRWPSA